MSTSSSEGIGAFAWLWNFGAFVISAILGWFGGWMAFIGSTKARLTSLEEQRRSDRDDLKRELDEMKASINRILDVLLEGAHRSRRG